MFDFTFTFVRVGWERTIYSVKKICLVLNNRNSNFPHTTMAILFSCSKYPIMDEYLPPLRNARYHISDFNEIQNQPNIKCH